MTNQQLYLAIGLPTLTSLITLTLVCLAWVSSRTSDKELRTEMDRRFEQLESRLDKRFDAVDRRFDAIDAELRYFHGTIGNHDARLTLLEKK